jgi:type IV pilus assembly protein PilP
MTQLLQWILVVSLIVGLSGCSESDFSDLNKYIAEVKARPKSAIEPLPEIKVVEPFLFNGQHLRDPFMAVTETANNDLADKFAGSSIKPDPLHQKEDLERYALDALKMVGTVRLNGILWGLIKVNDIENAAKGEALGIIYRVKVGNFMGTNYGKIIRITEEKIELMEIVPDKPGTWREQAQELPLVLAE